MIENQRYLVVDDHPLFCDALTMTLAAVSDEPQIRTANGLKKAEAVLDEGYNPDLIVLDLNLPDVEGLHGLLRLRQLSPAHVVVVSSISDNKIIASTLKAGASGFIPKDSPREVLIKALAKVTSDEIYTPPNYVAPEEESFGDPENILSRLEQLTPQQAKILSLVCEGKLNKQIAYDLSIAETTVKAHITAILRKLQVQSRTQAVLIAQRVNFNALLP